MMRPSTLILGVLALLAVALAPEPALAQTLQFDLGDETTGSTANRLIQLVALITILSLAPSILVMFTSFTRIVVVLSFLRSALGIQQTPPNSVLISLALFLTAFIMMPTLERIYDQAIQPMVSEDITQMEALDTATPPVGKCMLDHVREQIFGWLVLRLGLHQLVEDFLGLEVLTRVMQLLALRHDLLCTPHHLHVQRCGVGGRQRDQGGRIGVPVADEAVDDSPAVVLRGAVVATVEPVLGNALGCLVDVVDLVDGDALVHQVQHLVVDVGVEVALSAKDLLDPVVAPARPVVRGEHHLGLFAVEVQRVVDELGPGERVSYQGAAQRIDVVD